ncbi:MAG: hypothetical protein IKW77_07875 [Salinivirgaceae bacterium]|nr:hypothetical protein [Salinivirgaceae bacterium]
MNNNRIIRIAIVSAWFIAVFLFWRLACWGLMNYHEELQMFLFTSTFFKNSVSTVGGLADYVTQFLVQFFVNPSIGAAIVAALVVLVQILSYQIIRRITSSNIGFELSFIPSVAALCVMGYFETMLTALVSIVIGLALVCLLLNIKRANVHIIATIAVGLVAYFLAGTAAMLITILCTAACDLVTKSIKAKAAVLLAFSSLTVFIAAIIAHTFGTHSLNALLKGIWYMRIPTEFPTALYVTVFATVVTILFSGLVSKKINKTSSAVVLLILIVGGSYLAIQKCYDPDREELLEYSCMARQKEWKKIIKAAEKQRPVWVIEHNYLNLALAKTNLLSTRAFEVDQQKSPSLFVPFMRHHTMCISAGEVFYYLGFTNLARRHYSESLGAIPNHYLSVRYIKRMAEIDLINRDWKSAEKYLRLLQHTLFYDEWASQRLNECQNHAEYKADSEYGEIRSYRLTDDFLQPSDNYGNIIVELVRHNPQNRMAWDYALISQLLDKNISLFVQYFLNYVKHYSELPPVYQEAVLFAWAMSNQDMNNIPYNISSITKKRFNFFMNTLKNNQRNAALLLQKDYGNSVWYYLFDKTNDQ